MSTKSFPLLFAIALSGASLGACGASKSADSGARSPIAATAAHVATAVPVATSARDYTKADRDKDDDIGTSSDDTNNNPILDYGHAAGPADRRAITALVKRYYAAAAAGDGTQACSMLYITLSESVAEDQGHESAGPAYQSQGTTCPTVMALMFKHFHEQLAAKLPLLKVSRVRLHRHRGVAILSFGSMPERRIAVLRERRTWKIVGLLDGELP